MDPKLFAELLAAVRAGTATAEQRAQLETAIRGGTLSTEQRSELATVALERASQPVAPVVVTPSSATPAPAAPSPVDPATEQRAQPAPATPPAPDAIATERTRGIEISRHCAALGLPADFARGLIEQGVALDVAQGRILDEAGRRQAGNLPATTPIVMGETEDQKRSESLGLAFAVRLHTEGAGLDPEQRKRAESVMSQATPVKLARHALLTAGVSFRELEGLTSPQIIERALATRTHSTSDFPNLLESGVRRALRAFYNSVPQSFKKFSIKDNAQDYRSRTIVNVSGLGMPQKVPQGGEYKRTTLAEGAESWKVDHEGTIIGFTLQALANDDLGALRAVPQQLGLAVARAESRDFYQYLVSNPTMGDGVALFHASRGNTAAGGSLANDTALQAAYLWMWTRKDAMGNPIVAIPGFLLTPAALKIAANKLFYAQLLPETLANSLGVRTEGIEKPEIIADPYLDVYGTATGHYLIAASSVGPAFAYGYLEGAEGPQTSSQVNFNTGGVDYKVTTNFGVKALDANLVYQLT